MQGTNPLLRSRTACFIGQLTDASAAGAETRGHGYRDPVC